MEDVHLSTNTKENIGLPHVVVFYIISFLKLQKIWQNSRSVPSFFWSFQPYHTIFINGLNALSCYGDWSVGRQSSVGMLDIAMYYHIMMKSKQLLSLHVNRYISMTTEQTPSTDDTTGRSEKCICQTISKSWMNFCACERISAMLQTDTVIGKYIVLVG